MNTREATVPSAESLGQVVAFLAECGWRSVGKPHDKSEYVWMFERVTIPHHQAGLTCDHDGTFSLICQAKES